MRHRLVAIGLKAQSRAHPGAAERAAVDIQPPVVNLLNQIAHHGQTDAMPGNAGIGALAATEMALALRSITNVVVSRRSTYAKAPAAAIDEFLDRLR